jgi:hypothetical protein
VDFGFSDFGRFGLVLQRIRSGFSDFGLFTLVLHRYGSVFLLDVGLVFLLDFGLSYNVFSFACINIEILSAFISFHRLLFNQLLGKLICIQVYTLISKRTFELTGMIIKKPALTRREILLSGCITIYHSKTGFHRYRTVSNISIFGLHWTLDEQK